MEYNGGLKVTINKMDEDYMKGREMRTLVKDEISEWRKIKNEVSQELILAPIMFLVYVNDMTR